MSSSRTPLGGRTLSEVARSLHVPMGIVATGWPQVEHTCRRRLGIEFDRWKALLLISKEFITLR